jgi:hypothetical protein
LVSDLPQACVALLALLPLPLLTTTKMMLKICSVKQAPLRQYSSALSCHAHIYIQTLSHLTDALCGGGTHKAGDGKLLCLVNCSTNLNFSSSACSSNDAFLRAHSAVANTRRHSLLLQLRQSRYRVIEHLLNILSTRRDHVNACDRSGHVRKVERTLVDRIGENRQPPQIRAQLSQAVTTRSHSRRFNYVLM